MTNQTDGLNAAGVAGVAVKPLVWERTHVASARAQCPVWVWADVYLWNDKWDWRLGNSTCTARCETMEEAIAEVEEERASRIRSALVEAPAGETFGLEAESLEAFKFNSLKPEEIAGNAITQAKRIRELLHWFARLSRNSANPKWTREHAFELAYYIATTDDRAPIDIDQIEKDAWLKGVKATHNERGMMLRLGMITQAEFDAALASPAPDVAELKGENERLRTELTATLSRKSGGDA